MGRRWEIQHWMYVCGTVVLLLLLCDLGVREVKAQERPKELSYDISEELDEGSFIANLKADADMEGRHSSAELQQVKFRFLSPPKVSFRLEEETGVLRTGQKIDRDEECPRLDVCEYILDVVALIPATMTFLDVVKVRVVITDLNDNWPEFPETSISQDILESATLGTSIVVPTATDPDSTEYSIRDYVLEGDPSPFKLELREKLDGSVEVRLLLESPLDREKKDSYKMKVVAHDGGGKTGSIDVYVRVQDANDNDPVFENATYEVTIYENLPLQTTILTVHANDPDKGDYGRVVYGFSPQTLNSYHHLFGIDEEKGDLFIKGIVDFEEGSVYHLFVTAHDQGPDARTSDTTVIVRVKDINDHAPQIKVNTLSESGTDSAEISEDAAVETFVAHVTVLDPDSGDSGKFNCTLNDSHFQLQQLYQSEYKIITQALLDRETRSEYNLAITCKDRGDDPQVSIKHITVLVTDVNDNSPLFTQGSYIANLIENNSGGTFIAQVNATDRDLGDNAAVTYKLETSVRSLFNIDPTSGIITTRVTFDHEQTQQMRFRVTAVDRGEPPRSGEALVVVKITDVNDEVPTFSQPTYSFGVYENEPVGTEVGIVHAVDADSDPYNQFDLAFLPHERAEEYFAIDSHTGKITTRAMLDREKQGVYHLVVMAMDKGSPPMTSTATVSVYVADKNDNAPIFTYPTPYNNTVHISSKAPIGYRVTRLRAVDRDIGKNSNVTYSMATGTSGERFMVNAITGSVMVNSDLQDITFQMFHLEVTARDAGSPEQTTVASLNVVVNRSIGFPLRESPLIVGQNFTIVVSLACISALVVVILILAIVCIRRQDSTRRGRKHKAAQQKQKRLAQTPTSNDQLTMFSKVPNGGLENSACVKSQDDVKILISGPERKGSKKTTNLRQQSAKGSAEISTITPAHSQAIQHSTSQQASLASGSGPPPRAESGPWALAQKELEVHQLLHLLKKEGDADSTSSGEGSNTDSGRGPSEEGDRDHNQSRDHHNQSRDSQGGRRAERAAAAAAASRGFISPTGHHQPPSRAPRLLSPARDKSSTATSATTGGDGGEGPCQQSSSGGGGGSQGQGYFREGNQLTTFNPRNSYHRDPRAPRQPSPGTHPRTSAGGIVDPRGTPPTVDPRPQPEGLFHAAPVRLGQAPTGSSYRTSAAPTTSTTSNPSSSTTSLYGKNIPSGGSDLYNNTSPLRNHQLAGRGLGSSCAGGGGGTSSSSSALSGSHGHDSSSLFHHPPRSHSSSSATTGSSFRPNDVPLQHSSRPSDNVLTLSGAEPYSKDVVV